MTETLMALAETLDDIERLERQLEQEPSTEIATKLTASKQVAMALGRKLEKEQAEQEQREASARLSQLQAEYDDANEKLAAIYDRVNDHLTKTLDASEEALVLYKDCRRLEMALSKSGAPVRVRERALWSRFPDLRNRFINSVLRNGTP